MKKAEFRTEMSRKAMNTIKAIIKTEDLGINISIEESSLGDTLIVANGSVNEIKTLRNIYNMVK